MSLEVRWDHSGFSSNDVLRTAGRLLPRLVELKMVLERRDYTNDAASILLPSEREFIQDSMSLANEYSDSSLVVVIGIVPSLLKCIDSPQIEWGQVIQAQSYLLTRANQF